MSDGRLDRVEQLLEKGDVEKADQLLAPMVDELDRMGLLGEGHDPRVGAPPASVSSSQSSRSWFQPMRRSCSPSVAAAR